MSEQYPLYLYVDNGVTTLQSSQFDASVCKSIQSVLQLFISGTVMTYADYPMWSLVNMIAVRIGEGPKNLGKQTFSGCWELQYVELPETVTSITTFCFWKNYKLRNIVIPPKVTFIDYLAMSNTYALETVDWRTRTVEVTGNVFHHSNITRIIYLLFNLTIFFIFLFF